MIVGEKRVESERVERVKEFERGLKMRRNVCCKKVDIIIMRIIYKGAKINKKQLGKRIKSKSFLNLKPPSFPLSFPQPHHSFIRAQLPHLHYLPSPINNTSSPWRFSRNTSMMMIPYFNSKVKYSGMEY